MRTTVSRIRAARRVAVLAMLAGALAGVPPAPAAEATIAVATNFAEVMAQLEARFEAQTAHTLIVTTASTGKLYAQITQGAPFDVLLAADQARPRRLEDEGRAVAGSRFTYAVGRLVLWSPDPTRIAHDGARTLADGDFRALAIANPTLAPYGAAAHDVLVALGLLDGLRARLVMGENIGQTYSMIATGNAELGFVALAQVRSARNAGPGSEWEVPDRLHSPIRQDAVLLARGADNPAAIALLAFLRAREAVAMIAAAGYGADPP